MPVEALRIAMPVRVDRRPERVVARRRAVAGDSHDFAGCRRKILCPSCVYRIPGRDVQEPVRAEPDASTVVYVRCGDVVQQNDALRKPGASLAVPHDAIHGAAGAQARRLVEIDQPVLRELRIEGQVQEACLALGVSVRVTSEPPPVISKMRTRPGRSVTNKRPSGANAIDQGISRLVTTVSTAKRTPSAVVKTSLGGTVGVGAGVVGAGVVSGVRGEHARLSTACTATTSARMPATVPVGMGYDLRLAAGPAPRPLRC